MCPHNITNLLSSEEMKANETNQTERANGAQVRVMFDQLSQSVLLKKGESVCVFQDKRTHRSMDFPEPSWMQSFEFGKNLPHIPTLETNRAFATVAKKIHDATRRREWYSAKPTVWGGLETRGFSVAKICAPMFDKLLLWKFSRLATLYFFNLPYQAAIFFLRLYGPFFQRAHFVLGDVELREQQLNSFTQDRVGLNPLQNL